MKRVGAAVAAAVFIAAGAVPLSAAPPAVGLTFESVTLGGTPIGAISDTPTILFDPATGTFHMWIANDPGFGLALTDYVHATSTDGVDFTSQGNLSYNGGAPYPEHGADTEPPFQFVRAVRLGANWRLLFWTPFQGGGFGDYEYNVTAFDLGASPNTLAVTHQGPLQPVPGGTSGETNGMWGLVGTSLFAEHDAIGGIARYDYTDGTPPTVSAPTDAADLVTGTGFVNYTISPMDANAAYPSNAGRTLDQGDGTLGTFYALRFHDEGTRTGKQIFYVESSNGGDSWSAPVGLFADGNAITVDGQPTTDNFSHPEVTLANGARILYFSTVIGEGDFRFVTNVSSVPTATPTATGTRTATPTRTATASATVTNTPGSATPTSTVDVSVPVAPAIPTLSGVGAAALIGLLLAAGAIYLVRSRQ